MFPVAVITNPQKAKLNERKLAHVVVRLIVAISLLNSLLLATSATAMAKPLDSVYQNNQTRITPEALRASIGRSAKQPGFNPLADLNGDDVVNAQDVALFKLAEREWHLPSPTNSTAQVVAGVEQIIVVSPSVTVLPGETASVLVLLRNNTTPLSGYTVDVDVVASPNAIGTVTANVGSTNFFDRQNLISAGGAIRDPFFSVIEENGDGGVSITTVTDDFSTVLAVDGVNDVLAQVFFYVTQDAIGDFSIQFSSSSTLIDGSGLPVSFAITPGAIRVLDPTTIPTVSEWGMIVMGMLIVTTGCVVFAERDLANV